MLLWRNAGTMPYVVGYGLKNRQELWTAERRSARDALELVDILEISGKEIRFIKAPAEGEIGVEMLRIIADEERLP
jgi:hypothetical protein